MASLMKLLFLGGHVSQNGGGCLPLAGAWDHTRRFKHELSPRVGTLAQNVRFVEELSDVNPETGKPWLTIECPPPSGAVDQPLEHQIWAYDASQSPTMVSQLKCRVTTDKFHQFLICETISFGFATESSFKRVQPAVRVTFKKHQLPLDLTDENRLLTFATLNGANAAHARALWPLAARHDPSFVHVFVFDIERDANGAPTVVRPLTRDATDDDHPDRPEIEALINNLNDFSTAEPDDDRNASQLLFADDLWDFEEGDEDKDPSAEVPGRVDVRARVARVVVTVGLTLCRQSDDFAPGAANELARIYPHIMVAATAPLDLIEGGVHLVRPTKTTMTHEQDMTGAMIMGDSMEKMMTGMGALLIADSNANAMELKDPGVPFPYWANLFNYYVVDPDQDTELRARAMHVVKRTKIESKDEVGQVERDCSDLAGWHFDGRAPIIGINTSYVRDNRYRVTKFPRQGEFDNIHIAARMKVVSDIRKVVLHDPPWYEPGNSSTGDVEISFSDNDKEAWGMNRVAAAPFCPHDCLHMHWRWTNNDSDDYPASWGWGPYAPYRKPGATMVPPNQDVYLGVPSGHEYVYFAHVTGAIPDRWQVICHHGAAYAIANTYKAKLAELSARFGLDKMFFFDKNGNAVNRIFDDWGLFFWRLRFKLEPFNNTLVPVERFKWVDRTGAIKL